MKNYFAITFLLLWVTSSFSQVIKDPINDFLFSNNINIVAGFSALERLLILKIDLENNGVLDTLISYNGFGGNHSGNFWNVYISNGDGYILAKDNTPTGFMFRSDMFDVGTIDGNYGLIAFSPGKGGGDLNLFLLQNGTIIRKNIKSLNLSDPKDHAEFNNYFGDSENSSATKSQNDYPLTVMTLDDLRKAGYDVDKAIQAAQDRIDYPPVAQKSPPQPEATVTPIAAPTPSRVTNTIPAKGVSEHPDTQEVLIWPWIAGALVVLTAGLIVVFREK